jgi:hypothetical protein
MILGGAGLSMLVVGTIFAIRAEASVSRSTQFQLAGGLFIVAGLLLIGTDLGWSLNAMALPLL